MKSKPVLPAEMNEALETLRRMRNGGYFDNEMAADLVIAELEGFFLEQLLDQEEAL